MIDTEIFVKQKYPVPTSDSGPNVSENTINNRGSLAVTRNIIVAEVSRR